MTDLTEFPVFRKYQNNSSFFKVLSLEQFEEIKKMPSGFTLFNFEAKILPDRNYIHDMLYEYHLHWEVIEESEFEEIKALIQNQ